MAAIVADRLPRASARCSASHGIGVGGLYELRGRYGAGHLFGSATMLDKQ